MSTPESIRPAPSTEDPDLERFLTYGAGGETHEMTPFACPNCSNRVLVRKNGPAQTSVQWTEQLRCPQLTRASAEVERALIPSCSTLNAAIDEAVLAGSIPISAQLDGGELYLPITPGAPA